jgi:hypothetical protein
MSPQVEKLVKNQVLFREVNERLRETIGSLEGPIDFLCECSNEACIETVPLDVASYERVRSDPNLFIVVSGHETPRVEEVVDQGPGYVLVKKTVRADWVKATDPRSREA